MRTAERRTVMCSICGLYVDLVTLDSPHPEAPTLFQSLLPDFSPWFGFVEGGQIVVVCSEPCAQRLLEEG